MRNLFETVEKGKIGIFESPTGTVQYLFYFFFFTYALNQNEGFLSKKQLIWML